MSSVTTKQNSITGELQSGWEGAPTHEDVMEKLAYGLHQAAQPLTLLQGLLELALMGTHSEEDYRLAMKRALDAAQRAAASFNSVREMVRLPESALRTKRAGSVSLPETGKEVCTHV